MCSFQMQKTVRQQGDSHRGLHHKQLTRLRDEINEKQRVIDELNESVTIFIYYFYLYTKIILIRYFLLNLPYILLALGSIICSYSFAFSS